MSHAADATKARATSEPPSRPIPPDDPVLAALRRAPVGAPLIEDERHAMEQAREIGRWVSGADVHAAIERRCTAGK